MLRRLLHRTLTVMLAAIAFYVAIVFSLYKVGNVNWLPNVKYTLGGFGYTLLRLQELKKQKDLDVLFVGSSQVYRGFDTRIFEKHGINSFNLGTSSQTPFVSYYLLQSYLLQTKPKYVVMDLFWEILAEEGVEAGVDIISNAELNRHLTEMVWQSKNLMLFNTLLISGVRSLSGVPEEADQLYYEEDQYVPGGFVETYRRKNLISSVSLASLKRYKFKAAQVQLEYLYKIIDLCKEQNVTLMFVVTPVTQGLKAKVENYATYENMIREIAHINSLRIIDYNNRSDLALSSQQDFLDTNHLSQSGVIKFNKLFIADLQEIMMLANK